MNPPPYLPPEERKNTLMRQVLLASLIAVPILALVIFGAVFAVKAQQKAAQRRAALQEIESSAKQAQSDLKKNFDPKKGITNLDISGINNLREKLDDASQTLSGDDAIFAKVMAKYLNRIQDAATNYQAAMVKLRAAHVLEKFDPSDKEQITTRLEIVHQFMDANTALMQTIKGSEDNVRADLSDANIRNSKIDSFMEKFHSSAAPRNSLLIKIRQCDDRMGIAMLEVLNTLETQRGHWKTDATMTKIRFEDRAALDTYNEAVISIRDAGEEQLRLQKTLVNQPSQLQP